MEKIRSKSKKIVSVILSLAMILSAIPLGQSRVFAADVAITGPAIDGDTKTLASISVAAPSQAEVEQGAELDISDMLVTAKYSDDSMENLSSDDYEFSLDTSVLGTAVATVTSTASPTISDTFLVDVVPVNGKKVFVYDCETSTDALSGFGFTDNQMGKVNALKFSSNAKDVTIVELDSAISSGTAVFEIEMLPAGSCNEIVRIYNSTGDLLLEITNFITKYKITQGDGKTSVKDVAQPSVNSGGNLWTKLKVEFFFDDVVTNDEGNRVLQYQVSVIEASAKNTYSQIYEGWLDCGSIDQDDVVNKGYANGIYDQTIDGSAEHPFDIAKITVQGTAKNRWIGDVRLYEITPPAITDAELTTAPTNVEYMLGAEDIDLTGAVITETYEDDSTKEVSGADILDAYEVTAFDTSAAGTTTVVLTHKNNSELTVSFDVTVISATLESISIKTAPAKTEYYVGDEVELTGLVVEATYSNGSVATLEADEYTVDVSKLTEAGEAVVTVTAAAKDAAGNAVTAEIKLNVMAITTILEGRYAENYDEMGLTSTEGTTASWLAYVDEGIKGNKSKLLEVAKGGVVTKVFDEAATSGKVRLIAEYNANGGKGIFYNILDKDGNSLIMFGQFSGTNVYEEDSYSVDTKAYHQSNMPYITAVGSNQKNWVRFETMIDLDASNDAGVLQFTTDIYHRAEYTDEWEYKYTLTAADYSGEAIAHANGCATSALTEFSVGAVEFAAPSTAGYFDNMYAGVIATEGDTPVAPTLTSIVVTAAPTKVEYTTNDTALDLTGLVVKAVYSDDTEAELAANKYTVSTPDFTKTGAQTITVTAGENITATFEINVIQGEVILKSISVTAEPTNTVVEQGTELDLSGMQVTATYSDGNTVNLTGDGYAVTLDTNNLGTAVATVTSVENPAISDTFLVDVVPADGKKIFVFDCETAEEAPEGFKFYNNGEGTFYEKVNALQFNETGAYSLWNGEAVNNRKAVFEIELCPASKTDQAVQFYNAAGELLLEVSYIFGGQNEIHYTGYIAITDGNGNVLKTVAGTDELPGAGGNLWVKLNVEFDFVNVITDGAGNKSVSYTVSVIPQAEAEKYDTSAWQADAFTVKDTVAVSANGANLADVKAWCQYKTRCIGDFGLWEVEASAVTGDGWYRDLLEFDKTIESVDAIGATVTGTASIDTSGVKGNADHKLKVDKGGVVTKSFDAITTGKVKLNAELCGNGSTGIFYNILDKDGNPLILFGQYSNTNIYEEDSYDKAAKTYSTKYADGSTGTPYMNVIKGNKAYWIRFETEIDLGASNETGVLQAETKVYHKESYSGEWELKYTLTAADYQGLDHANGCATSALTTFSIGAVEYAGSGAAGYFDNMYVGATGAEGAALVGVTVTTAPTVNEYIPGAAALDLTGLVLTEKYSDGTTVEVSDLDYINAKYSVTGFDSSVAGTNTITLTRNNHEDTTAEFNVTIMNVTIASIEVTTLPTKAEYFVGDTKVDAAGMVVTATYNNGTKAVLEADDYVVGELNSTAAGTVKVTVTAVEKNAAGEDVTTTFDIAVKEPAVTGIKVTTAPYKLQYVIGDVADWSGMVVSLTYENGSTKAVDADKLTITGFDSSAAVDSQTITVAYDNYTTTFDIKVIDPANFTAVEYNFDFNIEGSTSADGWTGINVNKKKGTKYTLADYGYSAERGYGINTTVTALQGRDEKPVANPAYISIPTDAYKDYVLLGNANGSFDVDLANGTYNVMIIVGTTSANTTSVKIEDNDAYTGSVTISSDETKMFKVIEIPNVNVTDGQMNIATTADNNARVSAIIISNVSAPTGVNATLDTTDGIAVSITWNAVLGCEGYNVYRVHNGVTECIGSVEGMTTTTFKDTKVDCVETYTYFVRGISAKGLETIASNKAELAIVDSSVAAPATPANFKIAAMDTAATTLTWDAVENVSYYEVYGVAKGSETPDISSYTLITKVTENTYACDVEGHADMYFRIIAVGLGGKSEATDIAFSSAAAPKAPANLKVSDVADYATTLTWDASENAVYYEIYWSDRNRTDLEGLEGYEYVGKSSTTSFVYELSTHVERYFKVVAVGAGGRSDATASVKADIVKEYEVQAEYLDRGLVAIAVDGGVYVGWRLLGDEYAAEASYILYRDGAAIRTFDATENTSFLDADGTTASKYAVSVVIDEEEGEKCAEVAVQSADYLEVPIEAPEAYYDDKLTKEYIKSNYYNSDWYVSENILSDEDKANGTYTYAANDTYVGDVDGDGVYEIIVKWNGLSCDNSQSGYTSPVYLDCYKLDGTRLWRINLGINIRAGAHYTQPVVADLDGDGKAEVMVRTADGTVDGKGNVIGDATADYRAERSIIEGPDFVTLFDGETGEALDTIDYIPQRGSVSSWGDSYGGRSERFLSGAAYLDGEHISAIFARGYYTRAVVVAYTVENDKIVTQWICDSNDEENSALYGQGAHSFTVADVDGDGCQEIVYGAATIDNDGTVMYGLSDLYGSDFGGHGDAERVTDMNLKNPGLEIFMVHEDKTSDAMEMHDALTGEYIYYAGADQDVGRGAAGDIDPNYEGVESWSTIKDENGNTLAGLRDADGNIVAKRPSPVNHMAWFNGDMGREFVDNSGSVPTIGTWNSDTQKVSSITLDGCRTNNTTKANAAFQADMFGDWREEVAFRTQDNTAIRIYTSTETMDYRLYTLMHDPTYRAQMACNGSAYNQSPDAGFYIGYDTDLMVVPVPTLNVVKAIAADEVEVASIEVTSPDKVAYVVGEELDLTGMVVTAIYNNNTKKVLTEGFTVDSSKFDSSVAAEGIVITVTYGEFSDSFVVKVVNAEDRQSFYYLDEDTVDELGFTVTEGGSLSVTDGKQAENITNKLAISAGTATKKLEKAISSGKVTFEHVAYQNGNVYSVRVLDADGNGLISIAQQASGNYNLYRNVDTTGSPFQKLIASIKNKWVKNVIEIDLDKSNETGVLHFTMTLSYKSSYTDEEWTEAGVFTQENTYMSAANFGYANGAATSTLTSFNVGAIEFQSSATSYVDDVYFDDGTGIGEVVTSTRILKSIEITQPAAVTQFAVGSVLNTAGLEITGTYEITYSDGRTPETKTAVITKYDTVYDFSQIVDNTVVKIIVKDGENEFTVEYNVKVVPKSDGSYEVFEYIDEETAAIIGFTGSSLSVSDGEIDANDASNTTNRITVGKGTATKVFDTAFTTGKVHFETVFMTMATSKASLFLRILNSEGKPMIDIAQYGSANLNLYIDEQTSGTDGAMAGQFKGLPTKKWAKFSVDIDLDATKTAGHLVFDATVWTTEDYVSGNWTKFAEFDETLYLNSEMAPTTTGAASSTATVFDIASIELYNAAGSANYYDDMFFEAMGEGTSKELTGIEVVSEPVKKEYVEGDNFDATGLVIMGTYKYTLKDGTTAVKQRKITDYDVEFNNRTIGDSVPVVISVGDLTVEFTVKVTASTALDGIEAYIVEYINNDLVTLLEDNSISLNKRQIKLPYSNVNGVKLDWTADSDNVSIDNRIMTVTPSTSEATEAVITVGMVVQNAEGKDITVKKSVTFEVSKASTSKEPEISLDSNAELKAAVETMMELGLFEDQERLNSVSAIMSKLNGNITVEEFVAILVNLFDVDTTYTETEINRDDIDYDAWYTDYVIAAFQLSVETEESRLGKESFGIGDSLTKEDIIYMLARMIALDKTTLPADYADKMFE